MTVRVVVVDDSALVRSVLTEIINGTPDLRVVGTAADPHLAREVIRELDPDVITLDVEMPRMGGLDFLERLMRLRPTPVVMISTLTERGAQTTLRALELGAVDFVAKPTLNFKHRMDEIAREITDKVRTAANAQVRRRTVTVQEPMVTRAPSNPGAVQLPSRQLIAMGASTGGTEAIREVLMKLPPDAPGVVITQHMPPGFTASFASRLDSLCQVRVKEARDGETILQGHAYVAPGGRHLAIERIGARFLTRVTDDEPVNRHKPSVDVLFRSVAQHAGRQAIGVILTGMGADGALGMRAMRDSGAFNIAQDQASCVVFGMPREAIAAGGSNEVLALPLIAARLIRQIRSPQPEKRLISEVNVALPLE